MQPQLTAHFSSFVNFFKIMARTVEKKWSTEALSDYPSITETGWRIRTYIIWDNNLPIGGLGYARFKITTEGCEESRKFFVNFFIIMARTVENKWSPEALRDYPSITDTGWKIRSQIRWDNNLPRGGLAYVRFNITTEGCEEPRLSLKGWCVRVMILRFTEALRNCLYRIKIRIHIIWY